MTQNDETEIFYPTTVSQWRKWLKENHQEKRSVWLVLYSKASGKPTLTWSEAVDAALCFGWIDSKKIKKDEETAHQFFSKRRPNGTWSKINKEKVEALISKGLMEKAGYQCIETAKQNGSWTILDSVEALEIPPDLEQAFKTAPKAKDYFLGLSKSAKKILLQGLVLAKTAGTRQARIMKIIAAADTAEK
ncbi:MAG: YdeI/OmpD-associated family protein [Sphingobacterium sp.]